MGDTTTWEIAMRQLILIVLLVLASSANAVPVNPTSVNGVAAIDYIALNSGSTEYRDIYVLGTNGIVCLYKLGFQGPGWQEIGPVPVPVQDISDWTPRLLVTQTGDVWVLNAQWQNIGPAPCASTPVPSDSETMGSVKSLYR